MEITEHERVLLVNSLIQTISELYEHDGDNDRPRTRRAAYPHDGGRPGTRDACGKSPERSATHVPEMTADVPDRSL